MRDSEQSEKIKKIVGEKKPGDVWDEIYRLNQFVAKIVPREADDHGHAVRKIVGKPRAR